VRVHTKQSTVSDLKKKRTSLNVLISGFARQSKVSVKTITAIVDATPAFHLVGLDMITYDPQWETTSAQKLLDDSCSTSSKAVYMRGDRRILVFGFDDLAQFKHVLYHEIGHHVFERVIDSTLRKEWVTVVNPKSTHVTDYAAQSAAEDFAESYSVFLNDPARLQKIPTKYVFMRDKIFSGVARNLKQGHLDVLA
jgi:hypothetical protein